MRHQRLIFGCSVTLGVFAVCLQAQEVPVPLLPGADPPAIILRTIEVNGDGAGPILQAIGSHFPGAYALGVGGGEPSLGNLLRQPQIRRELELVDDQIKAVQELQKEFSVKVSEVSKQSFKGGRIDRLAMAEIQERNKALKEEFETKLKETLLPHQYKRLQEESRYIPRCNEGRPKALASKKLAEMLDLSEEQQQRIKEKSEEVSAKLQKQIAELREQAKKEVLDELTPGQKAKLKDLLGDKYEIKPRGGRSSLRLPGGLKTNTVKPKTKVEPNPK